MRLAALWLLGVVVVFNVVVIPRGTSTPVTRWISHVTRLLLSR